MVVCGALVVPPWSDVFTPQDLIGRPVGLDYGNGTAYAGLLMLEGAMPRSMMNTRAATQDMFQRYRELMRGDFDATVLQEPAITIAQKAGCRLVSTTFFYGTWVAAPGLDLDAYAAFMRALTRSVARINADKRRYLEYFLRAPAPEVATITPDDFDLGRIQLKLPGPIPEAQARWAWEWMSGWGVLAGDFDLAAQIDAAIEERVFAGQG
jgi:ABC-type nitrate/sulfonate/bicarbonate transport system substrate-binding protein